MLKNSIKNRRFRLLDDVVYFFVPASKVTEKQVYGKPQKHRCDEPNYSNNVNHSISFLFCMDFLSIFLHTESSSHTGNPINITGIRIMINMPNISSI